MLNNIFSTDSAFGKAIGLPAVSVGRNRYKKIPSSKNTIVPITEKRINLYGTVWSDIWFNVEIYANKGEESPSLPSVVI